MPMKPTISESELIRLGEVLSTVEDIAPEEQRAINKAMKILNKHKVR